MTRLHVSTQVAYTVELIVVEFYGCFDRVGDILFFLNDSRYSPIFRSPFILNRHTDEFIFVSRCRAIVKIFIKLQTGSFELFPGHFPLKNKIKRVWRVEKIVVREVNLHARRYEQHTSFHPEVPRPAKCIPVSRACYP